MQISTFSRIKVEIHKATTSFNDIYSDIDKYHVVGVKQSTSPNGKNTMITNNSIAVYDKQVDAVTVAQKLSELLGVEYFGVFPS